MTEKKFRLPPGAMTTYSLGPNVVNQVVFASTLYGCVARCGCGWRAVRRQRTFGRSEYEIAKRMGVKVPSIQDVERRKDGAA